MFIAIWYLTIVYLGFFRSINPDSKTLDFHVKIHAIAFLLWIILFVFQICLISANKRKLHALLGSFSIIIVSIIIPTGIYTIFGVIPKRAEPFLEVGTDLVLLLFFTLFYTLGIIYQKNTLQHKRYMLFATMALTSAAIVRIELFGVNEDKNLQFFVLIFPICLLFIHDLIVRKKIFKVNIYNTVAFFGTIYVFKFLWKTKTWEGIAQLIYDLLN